MQLEESYPRNKKENGNSSHSYQKQYKQLEETMRSIIKNY